MTAIYLKWNKCLYWKDISAEWPAQYDQLVNVGCIMCCSAIIRFFKNFFKHVIITGIAKKKTFGPKYAQALFNYPWEYIYEQYKYPFYVVRYWPFSSYNLPIRSAVHVLKFQNIYKNEFYKVYRWANSKLSNLIPVRTKINMIRYQLILITIDSFNQLCMF